MHNDSNDTAKAKIKIISLFNKNVRGKAPDSSSSNSRHDGKDGHWLERQMGILPNGDNLPDIFGFEMKNNTTSKTTFGDWSASYYIFKDDKYDLNRDKFLRIFGAPNELKKGRFSWSGKPTPKIKKYNLFGQILKIDRSNNIVAYYSFTKDQRVDKDDLVPKELQKDNLVIARWDSSMMTKRVEDKFNMLGWFKCLKNINGVYDRIVFGNPINFETWIQGVRDGLIYFDSGMYEGNPRPYSQWRADNKYWDSLIVDSY